MANLYTYVVAIVFLNQVMSRVTGIVPDFPPRKRVRRAWSSLKKHLHSDSEQGIGQIFNISRLCLGQWHDGLILALTELQLYRDFSYFEIPGFRS